MAAPQNLRMDNFNGFDSGFIDSLLHLMVSDVKFMRENEAGLRAELFVDDLRMKLADIALKFYKSSGCVAKNLYLDFISKMCDDERLPEARIRLLKEKASEIQKASANADYVSSRLEQYFSFAKLKTLRYQLDRMIDSGDVEGAKGAVRATQIEIGKNGHKPVDYFANISQRVLRRETLQTQEDGVQFLIPTLHQKGVFAHRGEITLVIAPSKRGKSVFLTHIGRCAIFTGHNVLHVSLENPISMVEDRYDAMLSGLEVEHLRLLADRLQTKIEKAAEMAKGRLYILWKMARTYSPIDLKADVERMRMEGKRIDTVIIDYGELLKPVERHGGESSMRAMRDDIFVNLRGIATKLDFVCVTAQQTPLKKRTKFRIYMEDGQESSMPAQHSSLIMTLNQTNEEQAAGEMRLYVDGYWHGPSGKQIGDILLKQDLARMQFCLKEIPVLQGVEAVTAATSP